MERTAGVDVELPLQIGTADVANGQVSGPCLATSTGAVSARSTIHRSPSRPSRRAERGHSALPLNARYRGAFEFANIVAIEPGRLSRFELTGGEGRSGEGGRESHRADRRRDAEIFTSVEGAHCRSVYFVDQLSLKVRRP